MRIAGQGYDWDVWPLRVAAGESEYSWHLFRLQQNVEALQRAIGLALEPVLRSVAKAMQRALE